MDAATQDEQLITAAQLAKRLSVSLDTVYRMCQSGKWQAVRIGRSYRFTEDQYQAIITPPPAVEQKPRTQRRNIERLLRSI